MTYPDFAEYLKYYCKAKDNKTSYRTYYVEISKDINIDDYLLYDQRHSGGITGGSCWDEVIYNYGYVSDDPWNDTLKQVIRKIAPNITFLHFDELESLYQICEFSIHEYYGNSSNYQARTISLKLLYDKLLSWGYLDGY